MESTLHIFYRYFPISSRDKTWGLYVTTVGESRITPGAAYPPGGHPKGYDFQWTRGRILPEYALIYISSGRGKFESQRGVTQQIEPGNVLVLFPGVWHRYMPDRETGWFEHWVGFDGDIARRWQRKGFISPENPVLKAGAEDALLALFTGMMQVIRSNRPAIQPILAGATCNAVGLLCSAQQAGGAGGRQGQAAIETAVSRMQAEPASITDVKSLARELGVGYSWFRSTFHQHTGLSPHRYLLELRLVRARNLLSGTDLTIKEVAAQAGIGDEHYFSRLFHKRIGCTPSQWRARSKAAGKAK